jgi:hypothetical protein
MLESQYRAHPRFGTEIKLGVLRKVQCEVERAAQVPDGRVAVDKPLRALMLQIAVPLRLGEMGETHFALGRHWYEHFNRQVQGQVTVAKLRAAVDEPNPMGLPLHAQNLILLVYADQANRSFYLHGGPYQPKLEDMPDELELREQALPSQKDWDEAINRAGKIFGIAVSPLRNASNLSDLATRLKDIAAAAVEPCQIVKDRLDGLCSDWEIEAASSARSRTAGAVLALVQSLAADGDAERRVEAIVHASVETSLDAMGTSYRKAGAVRAAIEGTKWELFEGVAALSDGRKAAAEGIIAQLTEALVHDEYAIALQPRLAKLVDDAIRLLTPKPPPPPPPPPPERKVVETAEKTGLSAADASALLAGLREKLAGDSSLKLDVRWSLYHDSEDK